MIGEPARPGSAEALTLESIREAHERIRPYVHRTPVITCASLDREAGTSLFFKCENLQKTGAFKARGACNAVMALDEASARLGVATHSSGNHAAALARAAALRGIPAHVVMPENSLPNKIAAVRAYGGMVTLCEATLEARESAAERIVASTGAVLIHPYDDPRIIAGQGTAAVEFLEQVPDLDVLMTPVGGGGLLAGTLIAAKASAAHIRVVAGEPALADDAFRSWRCGSIQQPERTDTVADGLRTALGNHTFPIIRDRVDDILLASEEAILRATRMIMQFAKTVVEPSAAVPLAALLENAPGLTNQRVGIILSGGNLDLGRLELVRKTC